MPRSANTRRVLVVTGSRAEYGLLEPVIRAVAAHPSLSLQLVAAGSHFLPPARTIRDVEAAFPIAARVPMQRPDHSTRIDDARAVARGIDGFTRACQHLDPDWVLVLGDRIEAFAAASAAAIAGIAVAHIHGGDRAEGIADESMRHAITKLAHLHLAATPGSAQRLIKMGELPRDVHVVGSPAIDGLRDIKPMPHADAAALGDPHAIVLLHPWGALPRITSAVAKNLAMLALRTYGPNILWLAPNHDAGRDVIIDGFIRAGVAEDRIVPHLSRGVLISLFKRLAKRNGVLIGNSSAGLIEAAAVHLTAINIGDRQAGRERAGNVIDVPASTSIKFAKALAAALNQARIHQPPARHPYGDGKASPRIARLLAKFNPRDERLLRKHNAY